MKTYYLGIITAIILAPTLLFVACDPEPAKPTPNEQLSERALDLNLFELDGDALDGDPLDNQALAGSSLGDDWETVNAGGGAAIVRTGVLQDVAQASIFTGGRKDIQDLPDWRHKGGAVPDKDDITNAYAAAYEDDGDLIIHFGADRFDDSGDAQMGFWFFQQNVGLDPNGTFSGTHELGDVLVLVNFQLGGSVPTINVLEWVGTGGDQQGGTLQMMTAASSECGTTTDDVCAITNSVSTPSPWPYTPKAGSPGEFPPQSFFEGAINISNLFGDGTDLPCFASFMAETRSSTSVTASLKDLVIGEFQVCGVEIAKQCNSATINSTEDAFVYDFSGTVTNTGFGTLYDVTVTVEEDTFELGTLTAGASAPFSGSFESDLNPASAPASVTAATSEGGPASISASVGPGVCPTVDRDPVISVTKDCALKLEDLGDVIALRTTYSGQVCNDSKDENAITLTKVTVTDDAGTPSDPDDDVVHEIGDLAPGACAPYSGSYQPSATDSETPSEATFSDSVTAAGEAKLGFGSASEVGSATCPLCL